jgi:hypothetical protein
MGPFSTDKWFVCHGIGSTVHFVELIAGDKLTTGQPNVEEFDDETSGLTRAEALGYTKIDMSTPDGELP